RQSKTRDIGETPQPLLYLPIDQRPQTGMFLFVHTAGDPGAASEAVRAEVRAIDANVPLNEVRTMAAHFEQQAMWGIRIVAQIVSAVGLVGLALSVLGLYAVIAYSVSERRREIGIRMAVGATEGRVLGMVLRQGLLLAAVGAGIGLLLTLALSTVIAEL